LHDKIPPKLAPSSPEEIIPEKSFVPETNISDQNTYAKNK